ncbi:MAG: F0F1 ATP synthase subunit epsilon, partial [Desulfovibrio sp.]|nr:F0F1 ATP synthase subunit epsilon [Desulfovibrio sp.]
MALHLEIVTPDGPVLSRQVDYVSVPGTEGVFGVLPGHIPLLSALAVGSLHYDAGE